MSQQSALAVRAQCWRFWSGPAQIVARRGHSLSGEYLRCRCAHANTRHCTEKQAFGGLDAQTALKGRDGGRSTCQVMDQEIVLAATLRSGVS